MQALEILCAIFDSELLYPDTPRLFYKYFEESSGLDVLEYV